jgi:eukaryotic-like serine/threonine-protein kinase
MDNLKHIALKGQGYFCIVNLYEDEKTGKRYALKKLRKEHYSSDEYRYRLSREIELLKQLQGCENIIKLIDSSHNESTQELWYLMPYAHCNLYDYIKNNNAILTIELRFQIIDQIIIAIKCAHSKSILHRDISPTNVLVFEHDGKPNIKVCDFGLGKNKESLSFYTKSSASGYVRTMYCSKVGTR